MCEIRDALAEDELSSVLDLYAGEWWTRSRTAASTWSALRSSDLVVTVWDPAPGRAVAMARVLTDFQYVALILDVIVAPSHRGLGVGQLLMDAVVGHPRLRPVESLELVCQPDVRSFYARWGFTAEVGQSRLMRRAHAPGG